MFLIAIEISDRMSINKWLSKIKCDTVKTGYVAETNHVTIADLALYTWVSVFVGLKKHLLETDNYPRVLDWAKRVKSALPNAEKSSEEGLEMLLKFFEDKSGLSL